jgi:NAD(P)-dependent dehydrogenase (short-subunit alcohol dehydrogenase family)
MSKTVLITGASSGIGRATAVLFQQKGWNVAATMRTPEKEKELAQLPNVLCVRLDVTDSASIDAAIKATLAKFGSIDAVVNNAGYGLVGAFEASTEEQIKRQFDTNVFGIMNVVRAILPYFRGRRAGIIANVTSMGGRITFPLYSLYHGTKWAAEGFSEALQHEVLPFGIKIKIIEPGPIKTDFYDRSMDVMKKDGLTAYDGYINKAMPNMQKSGATGASPEVVAKTIYKAVTDGSGNLRYASDATAKMLLLLRWLLPDGWFNGIVRKAVLG